MANVCDAVLITANFWLV